MPIPHRMAPNLMDNLFNWMNDVKEEGIIERVGCTPQQYNYSRKYIKFDTNKVFVRKYE